MLNLDSLAQLKELKQQIQETKVVNEGTVRGSMGRFGFVATDEGQSYFLTPDEMAKVFPGDRITFAETTDDKGKTQALVESLIKSEFKTFTGRFEKKGKAQFVEPDVNQLNHWLYLPPDACKGVENNDWVRCEVTRHPFPTGKPQAKVLENLGNPSDAGFERSYAISHFGLSHEWPETMSSELALLHEENIPEMAKGREDLTDKPFVTIDNEHTRDMDDALWAEKTDSGWTLHVAIADPSAWFGMNTALDKEAARRSNSLYFPGRSLPMLPPELANGLCSLIEGQDRLAILCSLDVAEDGKITGYVFKEALIRSQGKLSYTQVAEFLEGNSEALPTELAAPVTELNSVTLALATYRQNECLVMEDRPDFNYQINEAGKIVAIQRAERNAAQKLVEEAMLATNLSTARYLAKLDKGIFIQHDGIRPERIEDVERILTEQKIAFDGDISNPDGYKAMIKAIEAANPEQPLKAIISRMLTRSEFSTEIGPHTGMGFDCYTTFTSPIRKYCDLLIHRIIKADINKQADINIDDNTIEQLQTQLIAGRNAVNISESWLLAQFLQGQEGNEFEGVIAQANPSGFTVQLDETGINGVVDLRKVDKKFSFDKLYLTHTSGKKQFQLGQPIRVKLEQANINARQIRFSVVESNA